MDNVQNINIHQFSSPSSDSFRCVLKYFISFQLQDIAARLSSSRNLLEKLSENDTAYTAIVKLEKKILNETRLVCSEFSRTDEKNTVLKLEF
jgi:hypothetical protein